MGNVTAWQDRVWEDAQPEIGEERVAEVETALGVRFPEDYKACVKRFHGGNPRDNAFEFDDPDVGRMGSCLGVLLSFSREDPGNIGERYRRLSPFLPEGVIPFGDDGGGDLMCFQYHGSDPPTVVYWHHGERSVVPLAPTFSDFIEMLRPE